MWCIGPSGRPSVPGPGPAIPPRATSLSGPTGLGTHDRWLWRTGRERAIVLLYTGGRDARPKLRVTGTAPSHWRDRPRMQGVVGPVTTMLHRLRIIALAGLLSLVLAACGTFVPPGA